jgi:hypothetical protein
VGIIAGGRAEGGLGARVGGAGAGAGEAAAAVRWSAGGSVLVGRRMVRSSVSMRGRTEPRRLSGDGGFSADCRPTPRRFSFGVFGAFATGVDAAASGLGGSIPRMEPAKRVVWSSSSIDGCKMRGRSLGR